MRGKLKGTNIALFFGTWAPMHVGHLSIIHQAKRCHDGVALIVSGRKGDRGAKIGLDLTKRFRYVRETFKEDELVVVVKVDETGIPEYPDGWVQWLALAEKQVEQEVSKEAKFTIYVGEKEYQEKLSVLRPEWRIVLMDRAERPISATQIRKNPMKYWRQIAKPFRRHFSNNILIAGSASGGKTTLVKDLARSYGSSFSLEYARYYQKKYNVLDEELNGKDYRYLFANQYRQTSNEIEGSGNNGLVIADTNSVVTKAYMDWYLTTEPEVAEKQGKTLITLAEKKALDLQYAATIEQEVWALIFIIPPVTPYVDDQFRDMTMAEEAIRWAFHNHLLELFKAAGLMEKVVLLDVVPTEKDPQGFYGRYLKAQQIIKERLGISIWDEE